MNDAYLMLAIAEGFGESPCAALLQPEIDPVAVLRAPPNVPDVPPRIAERLRAPDLAAQAARIRARAQELSLQVLTPDHRDWPAHLEAMETPPVVLFARGNLAALQTDPSTAVVGSRTPTPYGLDAAETLCAVLTRTDVILWSGLARGVDAIAHEACLARGSMTVAVLAGGLDHIYPSEHQQLAERIVAGGGCLVSELPPGRRARRGHFVRRNRLLGTGPEAVVVVEGSLTSGTLHTARFAAECGNQVLCVPGPWRSERSQGCHRLIAEGASIIESPEALLHELGLTTRDPAAALRLEHGADEQALLLVLDAGPRPSDLLRREAGLDRPRFLRAMQALQHAGSIARLQGDLWRTTPRLGPAVDKDSGADDSRAPDSLPPDWPDIPDKGHGTDRPDEPPA